MARRIGSWGTPEFGITEKISDWLGRNRTTEGGSNIISNDRSYNVPLEPEMGLVQSVTTNEPYDGGDEIYGPPAPTDLNTGATSQTTQTGGGIPSGELERPPMPEGVSDEDISSIYDPAFSRLRSAEEAIRGQLPGLLSDIRNQAQLGRQKLETGREQAGRQLTESETAAAQRKEAATAAARRLFNELQQGLQQRFGGVTSAGMAAGQLQGREFQRQRGDIEQNYGQTVREIENQRKQVEEDFQNAVMEVENRKNELVNQAQREFQDRLMQINSQRGELESAKAAKRLEALQELRNQVYNINLQDFNARRELELARQQQAQQLSQTAQAFADSAQGGAMATDRFGQTTSMNPTAEMTVGDTQTGTPSVLDAVGQIARRREDEEGINQILNPLIEGPPGVYTRGVGGALLKEAEFARDLARMR